MIALNKIGQAASCLLSASATPIATANILALKPSGAASSVFGRQASSAILSSGDIDCYGINGQGNNLIININNNNKQQKSISKRYYMAEPKATSSTDYNIMDNGKAATATTPRTGWSSQSTSSNAVCYSDYETLQVSSPISRVLHIQLNRPGKRNALNRQALQELQAVFRTIHEDTRCRAVVISGEGKDFSSGLDHQDIEKILHEISSTQGITVNSDVARRAKFLRNLLSKYQETFNMVERCAKPVIASVHGACLGAALNLICCADVRFCAQDSFFQLKDVSAGMMADMGVLQRMPKMVANDSWIRELALTARRATSGEAKENGLVSRVYENHQQALDGALEMAASITNNSPVAVQGTKLCMNYSRDHSTHDGLVWALNWNMGMLQSQDLLKAMEGVGRGHDAPEFDDL